MRTHVGLLLIAAVCAAPAHAEPALVGIRYGAFHTPIEFKAARAVLEEFRNCENGTVAAYHSAAKFELPDPAGV
jgi:hypothetical protein